MKQPLYQALASLLIAIQNCEKSGNTAWRSKHRDVIETLVRRHMPSGSGFDNGTTLDLDASTGEKLIFRTSFHHMTEHGVYDGWTEHTVRVYPSLAFRYRLTIDGPDRNEIKELIGQSFDLSLREEVDA